MAELEVIKHSKKAYKVFHTDNPILEKLKEFFIEIFIIIFAVSITIWLHGWSEHRHQQQEVKEFLVGLKNDLTNDLSEMQADRAGYEYQRAGFQYFRTIKSEAPGANDSLVKYTNAIFNKVALVQNNGRYEGFKSSGKLGNIEDKKLQNDILDLYQELIPSLLNTTDLYNTQKDRLIVFIEQNARIDDERKILLLSETMKADQARIIAGTLSGLPTQILERYDVCIARIDEIVKAIDEAYDLKD
jgi:hypothetical protein